jgi:methionyl-tRNA synthetase
MLRYFLFSFLIAFKVFKQLNLSPETNISLCDDKGDIERARRPWEIVPIGHKIGKPEPLFKELVCLCCALSFTCYRLGNR